MSRLAAGEFRPVEKARTPRVASTRAWSGRLAVAMLAATIFAILAIGWIHRSEESFNPQHGLGYALGIIGGTMMLLVLLYPLRKRVKFMRAWARLAPWFRWHMVFGCVGPALVVVHAKFETQSLNGFMALASTLVVAGSGVIGRYLYVRIHRGLYGAKLEARELLNDAVAIRLAIGGDGADHRSGWEGQLKEFEKQALAHPASLSAALRKAAILSTTTRSAERKMLRAYSGPLAKASGRAERAAQAAGRAEMQRRLARYFRSLRRAGSLAVYERLFALWHVLHLPLIVLLVFTAIVHVVAVHLY